MRRTDLTCSYCSDEATHEVSYGDGVVTERPTCWYHLAAAFDEATAAQASYFCPPQVKQLAPELVPA